MRPGPVAHSDAMRPVAHLVPQQRVQINIKTQAGKTITLDVEESDTMINLKDALECYHGITSTGKRLMKECPEHATIGQLGIQNGDTLHLVDPLASGKKIFVKTPTGRTIIIDVDVSDTVEKVKRKIARMEGVDAMTLSLHLEDGRNFFDYIIPGGLYIVAMLPAYDMPRTPPLDFGVV
jgi:ubiquitin C